MAACVNHAWIETNQACANCGQPFCDSCLVELLGQRYCGPCRDLRLTRLQGPADTRAPYAGTGTVNIGRWLSEGWQIVQADVLTFALATLLFIGLSILSAFILAGPLLCGLYLMAYRKMVYGQVEIGHLFDGFRRFLWAFLASLLIFGGRFAVGYMQDLALAPVRPTPDNMGLMMTFALFE